LKDLEALSVGEGRRVHLKPVRRIVSSAPRLLSTGACVSHLRTN